MITLYDLAAKEGIKTISPNPWKIRYILNYKKLSYKTVTFELPDIESEFKKLGIPPSSIKPDGTPFYTSPSIIDHETNTPATDSYQIAEYLDGAYPETPRVIPKGTEALQAAFYDQFAQVIRPIYPFLVPAVPSLLNPVSVEYFTRTQSKAFGKPISELAPQGEARVEEWKKVEAAFDTLNKWLSKSTGPFFMGETVTFADFVVASMLKGLKIILNENSKEWKDMMTWNNGRWKVFLESLELYGSTDDSA